MKFRINTASGEGIDTEREIYSLEQLLAIGKEYWKECGGTLVISLPHSFNDWGGGELPTITIADSYLG